MARPINSLEKVAPEIIIFAWEWIKKELNLVIGIKLEKLEKIILPLKNLILKDKILW